MQFICVEDVISPKFVVFQKGKEYELRHNKEQEPINYQHRISERIFLDSSVWMSRWKVLSTYKRLLTAQRDVFGGDIPLRKAAQFKTKTEFTQNKLETDHEKINSLIKYAEDVESFLRTGLLQAEVNPEAKAFKLRPNKTVVQSGKPIQLELITKNGIEGRSSQSKCCSEK
jgi:hypothetical protein